MYINHPVLAEPIASARTTESPAADGTARRRLPRIATLPLALVALIVAVLASLAQPHDASAAPSAKYRVTLDQVEVLDQTWDDWWRWDGCGDEVFVSYHKHWLTKNGEGNYVSEWDSKTYGDRNGYDNRISAGSCGTYGGLNTGNSFYPNIQWEGDLVQGENAMLITPSLWEWDQTSPVADWIDWGQKTVTATRDKFNELIPGSGWFIDWAKLGLDIAASAREITGTSGTRPIGMTLKAGSTDEFEFKPQTLKLTYDSAKAISEQRGPDGKLGSVHMVYRDATKLQGRYQVYLRVEKLQDNPPTPTPPAPVEPPDEPIESPLCQTKPWLCG
jgi:hypothetical protein